MEFHTDILEHLESMLGLRYTSLSPYYPSLDFILFVLRDGARNLPAGGLKLPTGS